MGATDCVVRLKGTTHANRTKYFWSVVKEAQAEYGHSGYSGTAAEFSHIVVTSRVFNTYEEMQEWVGGREKNVAHFAQIKMIKDSATIERWIGEAREISNMIWHSNDAKFRGHAQKTLNKINAKIRAARLRKAEASKRTEWYAVGMVSE